jgi:hypothetical protein
VVCQPPLLPVRGRGSFGPPLPRKFALVLVSRNDCSVLRSEIVPLPGERSAVVVVRPWEARVLSVARGVAVRARLEVLRVAVRAPPLEAVREVPGCARLIVGTPLDVVRVDPELERGSVDELLPPLLRLVEPELLRVGAGVELDPDERLIPPLERLVPPEDRLVPPLDERLVPLPDDRLVPPLEERLVPPDDRLVLPPDERLTPPDDLPPLDEPLTPPDEREPELGKLPEERLLPPLERELPLLPPLEREPPLLPPDERELPPPRLARCASTRFTGAANNATANTAKRKKKSRLGVGISDLRLWSDAG